MKKFFYILIITVSATVANAQVDPQSLNLNIPLLTPHVAAVCHAQIDGIWPNTYIVEMKKSDTKDSYQISLDGGTWVTFKPKKGEKMLRFMGTNFYSIDRKALVARVTTEKLQKVEKTPEEKARTEQIVMEKTKQVAGIVFERLRVKKGW